MLKNGFGALRSNAGWFCMAGLLIFNGILANGCGSLSKVKKTSQKIVSEVTFTKQDIRKTVGLTLFQDKTFASQKNINGKTNTNLETVFRKYFSQSVTANCSDIFLITPNDSGGPEMLITPPRLITRKIDNVTLAEAGERLGMNAVITGTLSGLSAHPKETGFFWLRKRRHMASLFFNVEVYDTQTAAKIFDESFTHEFEVDEPVFNAIHAKHLVNISAFEDEIKKAASDSSKRICKTLSTLPWKGRIVSVSGSQIVIGSGQQAGIKPGDVFTVYAAEKQLQGAKRFRYFQPGEKYAEIKITAVSEDRASAVSVSGGPVTAGSSIRLKR